MGSETVLVVEDNAPLRRLTERMLQRQGYHVLVASNGEEARRISEEFQGPIPVVLMDVIMPGESGPSIGDWICRTRAETKIVYTSGYTGFADDHDRVARSGTVFLQKPFSVVQLVSAIRSLLPESGAADAGVKR